jgi:hypothetical protein
MADTAEAHLALGDVPARQLANATKTAPTMGSISPRWLVYLLPWVAVESGIYRLNKVKDESRVLTACSQLEDERDLPETFVDYEEEAREYYLRSVTTVVDVHTRVSDLYSQPFDQVKQQLRLTIETASIGDAVGLGAAIDYLQRAGIGNVARYEHELLAYATDALLGVPGLRLFGTAPEKASVLSFTLDGIDDAEVGKALDADGIAVRTGHHCAQPVVRRFGRESMVRASLAFYNTREDVDALAGSLRTIVDWGGRR